MPSRAVHVQPIPHVFLERKTNLSSILWFAFGDTDVYVWKLKNAAGESLHIWKRQVESAMGVTQLADMRFQEKFGRKVAF
jgi:hypothetical protein